MCKLMKSKGFGGGMEYLPTQEDTEKVWIQVWEIIDPSQRKNYEDNLNARDPKAFQHFRDNVLVKHPEYKV